MSVLSFTLYSNALMSNTEVTVILPVFLEYENTIPLDEKFQTLWLLHGGMGSSSDWTQRTNIAWYAEKHRFAVVIPDCGTNHYNDVPGGPAYFTYVAQELPALLRKYFPLSDKREDNFIAGLSMGGFGAAKCAFNYPEHYGAVGLFSTGPQSSLQLRSIGNGAETEGFDRFTRIFGGVDKIPHTINDIWYVLEQDLKENKELPLIYDCCGTDDPIYPSFRAFLDFAEKHNISLISEEWPGWHAWDFWNQALERFIDWLPLLKTRNYILDLHKSLNFIQPQLSDTAALRQKILRVQEVYTNGHL